MQEKLLRWLFAAVGLCTLVYGCHNMAAKMTYGERLYRAKCSSCHNIIAPSQFDQVTWQLYIDKYGEKLTNQEKETLLQYLAGSE